MQASLLLALSSLLAAGLLPANNSAKEAFELKDNLVRLPAIVDGRQVTSVLDSGTSQVILDRPTSERIGLLTSSPTASALGGGSGPQPLSPIVIQRVQVGSVQLENVNGFAMTLKPLSTSAGFQIEVLLGGPIFESHVVQVDYQAHRVSFLKPERFPDCKNPIPIAISSGVPVATVLLNPKDGSPPITLHMIVDLGTRHYAAVIGGRLLDTEEGKALLARARPAKVGTGTGGAVEGSVLDIGRIDIGSQTFTNVQVALTRDIKAFQGATIDGTLGVPLWNKGSITFDYSHRQLCLVPGGSA